jgi:hypothetical protein
MNVMPREAISLPVLVNSLPSTMAEKISIIWEIKLRRKETGLVWERWKMHTKF